MLEKPDLFRTKDQILEAAKNRSDKINWFKQSGDTDVILNIPPTVDQKLLKSLRVGLNKVNQAKSTRVRPQQAYGRTVLSQIMTRTLDSKSTCDRQKCLVCNSEGSKGNCKVERVC